MIPSASVELSFYLSNEDVLPFPGKVRNHPLDDGFVPWRQGINVIKIWSDRAWSISIADPCAGRVDFRLAVGTASRLCSSNSISSTPAGGSAGGPSARRRLLQRRPFWWRRRSASHAFWYRFERRTLRRGLVSDRFLLCIDGRSYSIRFCLTLPRRAREEKGLGLNIITIRTRENNLTDHIHI